MVAIWLFLCLSAFIVSRQMRQRHAQHKLACLQQIRLAVMGGESILVVEAGIKSWSRLSWYDPLWSRVAEMLWRGESPIKPLEEMMHCCELQHRNEREARQLVRALMGKYWGLVVLALGLRWGLVGYQSAFWPRDTDALLMMGGGALLVSASLLWERMVSLSPDQANGFWSTWEDYLWDRPQAAPQLAWQHSWRRFDEEEGLTGVSRRREKLQLLRHEAVQQLEGDRFRQTQRGELLPLFELLGGGIFLVGSCLMPFMALL